MKISAGLIEKVKASEYKLRAHEREELVRALPEDHPSVARTMEFGDDLANLPEGHPVIVELRRAKQAYEDSCAADTNTQQSRAIEVRKAKKIARAKAQDERLELEDKESAGNLVAANAINRAMEKLASEIKLARGVILENRAGLSGMCRRNVIRAERASRLLDAMERGVQETRMSKVV
jgi:hypothetical protein